MENRIFYIFNVSEINKIDFEEVKESTANTLRRSVDGTKSFIKFDSGSTPSFLNNLTTKEGPYTYPQMLNILTGSFWSKPITGSLP